MQWHADLADARFVLAAPQMRLGDERARLGAAVLGADLRSPLGDICPHRPSRTRRSCRTRNTGRSKMQVTVWRCFRGASRSAVRIQNVVDHWFERVEFGCPGRARRALWISGHRAVLTPAVWPFASAHRAMV